MQLMDPQEFQDWINEEKAKQAAAAGEKNPLEAPNAFHKGEKEETLEFNLDLQDNLKKAPNTAVDRSADKIVNTLERLAIQQDFEQKFNKIEANFDKKIADVDKKLDSASTALEQHKDNFKESYKDFLQSNQKYEVAQARQDKRETELASAINVHGTPKELDAKTNEATKGLDIATDKADSAKDSLVNFYANQSNKSAEKSIGKHLDNARADNNEQLEAGRSTTHTDREEKEASINGTSFNQSEVTHTQISSWRDKLANAIESVGVTGIADKIRGTDEAKTKEIAVDKSFNERQLNLMIDTKKATDPDVKERLSNQQVFEKSYRDLTKMQEMQKAGVDSPEMDKNIEKTKDLMTKSAEQMARADIKLADKNINVQMVNNRAAVIDGPADQIDVTKNKIAQIDVVDEFKLDRQKAIQTENIVVNASLAFRGSKEDVHKASHEVSDKSFNMQSAQTSLNESKSEVQHIVEQKSELVQMKDTQLNTLTQEKDAALGRVDQKELNQTQEKEMAIAAPTNPASERAAARINALDAKPAIQASERELKAVSEHEATATKIAQTQTEKQTQSNAARVS